MQHIVQDMVLAYECKNSVRYDAAQQDGKQALSSTYIGKQALGSQPYPAKLRITITERDD
jgi:hypothetical protein